MKLHDYIAITGTAVASFAERIGVTRQQAYRLIKGDRQPSPACARRIEEATEGAVTLLELRPDIYGPPPTTGARSRERVRRRRHTSSLIQQKFRGDTAMESITSAAVTGGHASPHNTTPPQCQSVDGVATGQTAVITCALHPTADGRGLYIGMWTDDQAVPHPTDPADELRHRLAGVVDRLDSLMPDVRRCAELMGGRARFATRDPRVVSSAERGWPLVVEIAGLLHEAGARPTDIVVQCGEG